MIKITVGGTAVVCMERYVSPAVSLIVEKLTDSKNAIFSIYDEK